MVTMDFSIPGELTALRESFRAFLDREVRPLEDAHADAIHIGGSAETHADLRASADATKRRSCEEGFYAAHLPEEVGGWGLSSLGMTLLVEDAAHSGLRLAASALGPPDPGGPTPLLLQRPGHLRSSYLKPLMSGAATMCFALTEPEAGSDAQAIRTRAVRDGDEWVIDGTKHYITGGDRADFAVVFAVTDADKRAHGGITAFIVPSDAYTVGKKQHTMADSHPVELIFDASRIPADHVIGEFGYGSTPP